MKWVIRAYAFLLLGYTGWRTFDFMRSQLPKDDTSFFLAILFLFACEAGLLIWHEISLAHTTTFTQHSIATWMTWIDFAASLGAGTADMIIRQTIIDYTIPPWMALSLMYGLPVIVALNVAATLLYQVHDAEVQLDQQQRFLQFEASRQAIKQLNQNRGKIVTNKRREIYGNLTRGYDAELPATTGTVQPELPETTANPTKARKPN